MTNLAHSITELILAATIIIQTRTITHLRRRLEAVESRIVRLKMDVAARLSTGWGR